MASKKQISNAQNFLDKERRKFKKTVRENLKRRNAAFNRVRAKRNQLIKLKKRR